MGMNNAVTKQDLLNAIDAYEGMIKLAWLRGERAETLLAHRQILLARLAGAK